MHPTSALNIEAALPPSAAGLGSVSSLLPGLHCELEVGVSYKSGVSFIEGKKQTDGWAGKEEQKGRRMKREAGEERGKSKARG